MALAAAAAYLALRLMGLNATILAAFAPDFALVLGVVGSLLCLPAVVRAWRWTRLRKGPRPCAPAP